MSDQRTKYIDDPSVKLILARFMTDDKGYNYLCDKDVAVGDYVITRVPSGELKPLEVLSVKDASEMLPNPHFKRYAWVCAVIPRMEEEYYHQRDRDIDTKPFDDVKELPKKPVDDLDDRLKAIFGDIP